MDETFAPPLGNYLVLSGAQITNVNSTTIRNGNLGSLGGSQPTGMTYVNGVCDNTGNVNAAHAQLRDTVIPTLLSEANIPSEQPSYFNDGNRIFYPGGYASNNVITLATHKTVTFDALGDAEAQFYVRVAYVLFDGGTIQLSNSAQQANIYWLVDNNVSCSTSNQLLLGNFIVNGSISLSSGTSVTGRLYTLNGAINLSSNTVAIDATPTPPVPPDPPIPPVPPEPPVPCYLKGTKILTNKGYIPIENLTPDHFVMTCGDIYGDNVINCITKYRRVKWVGQLTIKHPKNEVQPICIKHDTYGPKLPINDLYVSPDHNIILNRKLFSAASLINNKTICRINKSHRISYYHVELDRHSAIVAEGIQAESYKNVNNKFVFEKVC